MHNRPNSENKTIETPTKRFMMYQGSLWQRRRLSLRLPRLRRIRSLEQLESAERVPVLPKELFFSLVHLSVKNKSESIFFNGQT